tara:strand:- start:17042 stop:17803 length:762 start_codon:yes stop_codon:yes gene_type:complete
MVASFIEGTGYGLLNDVLGAFRSDDGSALPNRYEIEIAPPSGVGGSGSGPKGRNSLANVFSSFLPSGINPFGGGSSAGGLRNIVLKAEQVTLPGRNLETADDPNVYGPIRRVVNGVNFAEDIQITFQCSTGLEERKFFENWQTTCYDTDSWNLNYYNEYCGTLSIFLLDKNNTKRYGLKCWEVYPKTVGGAELNYQPAGDILKIAVGFQFRYWEAIDKERLGGKSSVFENMANTVINSAERNLMRNVPKVFKL